MKRRRKLQVLVKDSKNPGTRKAEHLREQCNILHEKIRNWEVLRGMYMPGLIQYLSKVQEPRSGGTSKSDVEAENVPLWLPSSLPLERYRMICAEGLPLLTMEDHL